MDLKGKRALILTSESEYAVGLLFQKALKAEGFDTQIFDLFTHIAKYTLGGKIGSKVNAFWPVDAWRKKANRDLSIRIRELQPDLIFISGDNPVNIGTLAFARSILPNLKVVLFWPDTLVNLSTALISLSPMIDVLASYSSSAFDQFKALGFREVIWTPFAGDLEFLNGELSDPVPNTFKYDCTFIGGWRPERERAVQHIVSKLPGIHIKVVGPYWHRSVENRKLLPLISNTAMYGKAYGDFLRSSRINLNIIDDTNYPAANMRFFEIPAAGALQVSSACPEQEEILIDGKHLYYYKSLEELSNKIHHILNHPEEADTIRRAGYNLVSSKHTYEDRIRQIVSSLNISTT